MRQIFCSINQILPTKQFCESIKSFCWIKQIFLKKQNFMYFGRKHVETE